MRLNLRAELTEEDRKQIREIVLGDARAVARNLIDDEIRAEVKRVIVAIASKFENSWPFKNEISNTIKSIFRERWHDINQILIETVHDTMRLEMATVVKNAVEKAVDKAIQAKMDKLTVWKADQQEEEVRRMAREEMIKVISGRSGK